MHGARSTFDVLFQHCTQSCICSSFAKLLHFVLAARFQCKLSRILGALSGRLCLYRCEGGEGTHNLEEDRRKIGPFLVRGHQDLPDCVVSAPNMIPWPKYSGASSLVVPVPQLQQCLPLRAASGQFSNGSRFTSGWPSSQSLGLCNVSM